MKKFLTVAIVVLAALPLASSAQASTAGQRNALNKAQSYLRVSAFSKSGLVEQLKYDHFSTSDARWAVAHLRVSWNAQVVPVVFIVLPPGPHRAARVRRLHALPGRVRRQEGVPLGIPSVAAPAADRRKATRRRRPSVPLTVARLRRYQPPDRPRGHAKRRYLFG